MNQAVSGLETNMIILIGIIFLIAIGKFILWTIAVHRTNLKLQQKLGKEAFDWMVFDGEKAEEKYMTEENVKEVLKLLDELKIEFVTNLVDSIESLRRKQMSDRIVNTMKKAVSAFNGVTEAVAGTTDSFKKLGSIMASIKIKGVKDEI